MGASVSGLVLSPATENTSRCPPGELAQELLLDVEKALSERPMLAANVAMFVGVKLRTTRSVGERRLFPLRLGFSIGRVAELKRLVRPGICGALSSFSTL